ncbi:hypothetical protein SAMD00019534_058190 [Acytostelium subglobosum LB1]|uniref:hypothetical protein n=1 Tax=Acytostelium subglobosum LB1 TaxID=1410327 RepID=UPI000644F59F|nr:hypothetical protein SAMD00019534_058190 [Acytostelium subglobosum LB1]GAM22644.1 hypothetical protein SAMD00019534_058190 [Acytostelium subglobosum LB1]|eukprot:XP_012754764.1 hypothetical protein SAMD00019534_058190 [Acytostelium subglobosum LB1]
MAQLNDYRQIRAVYDENNVIVYQAYSKEIAAAATKSQFLSQSPSFSRDRMTWIKPSFLWMMYRCGWATKQHQEHVLAITITRDGFEWALANSSLSHFNAALAIDEKSKAAWQKEMMDAPVRVQWDPEKNIHLKDIPQRSIQIGISRHAVAKYIDDWIVKIEDITAQCDFIKQLIDNGKIEEARRAMPQERLYPLPPALIQHLGATYPPPPV